MTAPAATTEARRRWREIAESMRLHVNGCPACGQQLLCITYARLEAAEREVWKATT